MSLQVTVTPDKDNVIKLSQILVPRMIVCGTAGGDSMRIPTQPHLIIKMDDSTIPGYETIHNIHLYNITVGTSCIRHYDRYQVDKYLELFHGTITLILQQCLLNLYNYELSYGNNKNSYSFNSKTNK